MVGGGGGGTVTIVECDLDLAQREMYREIKFFRTLEFKWMLVIDVFFIIRL